MEFVDLIYGLARQAAADLSSVTAAVLAVPGPFDLAAGVSYMRHKLKSIYGIDLRGALAARFGWKSEQFYFLNDAAAFLLGELEGGAARGAGKAVGIALGTGIGSAFAQDGRWVTAGPGVPAGGEIWNLPYGDGIVEDLLSTRAIKEHYARRAGTQKDVVSIAECADVDPDSRFVFERFGSDLGQAMRDILSPFAPEVIVIGGRIAQSSRLFLPSAQKQLSGFEVKLVTSTLLDEAPLVGAVAFWRNDSDIQLASAL